MGTLKFNGVSTVELGFVIQTPPVYEFPTRKVESVQVDGKNGDILIDKNSYNNTVREYNIASVFKKGTNFVSNSRMIVDWLTSNGGYSRLEDSYEPEYFRLATYRDGGSLPNLYDKATAIIVRFDCKPQRYLKSGDEYMVFAKNTHNESEYYTIHNPTNYIATPEIIIQNGVESVEITNNNHTTIISFIEDTPINNNIIINSEIQDVYNDTEFLNNRTKMTDGFPKLYPGENKIKIIYKSEASKVLLKPKWWVL